MKKIISVLMSLVLILSAVGLTRTSADEKASLDIRIVTVADTVSYLVVDASKYESGVREVLLDRDCVRISVNSSRGAEHDFFDVMPFHGLTEDQGSCDVVVIVFERLLY